MRLKKAPQSRKDPRPSSPASLAAPDSDKLITEVWSRSLRAFPERFDTHANLREAGDYIPMMAVPVAGLIGGGFTVNRVLAAGGVMLLLGGIPLTLWWAERRIAETPLDRPLLQALTDLRSKVDGAGRAYLTAYVALFVVTAAFVSGFIWWQSGVGQLFAGTAVLSILAVMWAVRSGRAYVERMFRRHRVELTERLRELEEQA